MTFYVQTGDLRKTINSKSPKQAAVHFLNTENGPFAKIIGVHYKGFKGLDHRDRFFFVETLLSEQQIPRKIYLEVI